MSTKAEAEAAIPALRVHVGEIHRISVEERKPGEWGLLVVHEDPWVAPVDGVNGVPVRVHVPVTPDRVRRPRPPRPGSPGRVEIQVGPAVNGISEARAVPAGPPRRGSHRGDPRHAATVAEAFLDEHGITGQDEKFYDALVDVITRADSLLVFTGNDDRLHVVGTGIADGPPQRHADEDR